MHEAAGGVAFEADRLLDRARSLSATQRWSAASELAEALLENLDNVHDEGEIYGAAERACALLVAAAQEVGCEAETLEQLLKLEEGPYGEIPWSAAEALVAGAPTLAVRLESRLAEAYAAADPTAEKFRHQTLGHRLKSLYLASGREVQVAEHAAPFFPAEASAIFRRQAERVCEGRDRKAYRLAAWWAGKAKSIVPLEDFMAWLVDFLARNRRYSALQEEFNAVRT